RRLDDKSSALPPREISLLLLFLFLFSVYSVYSVVSLLLGPWADLAEEGRAGVLHLEEGGALRRGLVDLEGPHDAQRGGALQRPDEARVAVEEVRPGRPALHLGGAQEVAAGVRVEGAAELDALAEHLPGQHRVLAHVLERRRRLLAQVAVDVGL